MANGEKLHPPQPDSPQSNQNPPEPIIPQLTPGEEFMNWAAGVFESPEQLEPVIKVMKRNGRIKWQDMEPVLSGLSEFSAQQADRDQFMGYIEAGLIIWEVLPEKDRKKWQQQVKNAIFEYAGRDRIGAAAAMYQFKEERYRINRTVLIDKRRGVIYDTERDRGPRYLDDTLKILEPGDFNAFGKALTTLFQDSAKVGIEDINPALVKIKNGSSMPCCPKEALMAMAECFVEAGLLTWTGDGYGLKRIGRRKETALDYSSLLSTQLAGRMLSVDTGKPKRQVGSLVEVEKIYQKNDSEIRVPEMELKVGDWRRRILYIADFLMGQKDTDVSFLRKIIAQVKKLPEEKRPQLVVASGLLYGGFQLFEKSKRRTLAGDMSSVDNQFRSARMVIKEFTDAGIPVVYVLSSEDEGIIQNYTVEALRMLEHIGKPLHDAEKRNLNWAGIDQLKQHRAWDRHENFQRDVVFPYCLRSGRRLRSADEVERLTKGALRVEEYLILYETMEMARKGIPIPPIYQQILDMDNVPFPGKKFDDFFVMDGLNLWVKTLGKTYLTRFRHNLSFSPAPKYANPTQVVESLVKSMLGQAGQDQADETVIAHQSLALGIGVEPGRWVVSLPSGLKTNMDQRQSVFLTTGDPVLRLATTARRPQEPAVTTSEFLDDGRYRIRFFNPTLLEKAFSLPERTTIIVTSDLQNGSETARPDLQVKLLSIVADRIMPNYPVVWYWNGDISQGHNYKGFHIESRGSGLISVENQMNFEDMVLHRSLDHVPVADRQNLKSVGITPGNHELNSGYQWLGTSHSIFLRDFFRGFLGTRDNQIVRLSEAVTTSTGEYFRAQASLDRLGAYGILTQHGILERAAKGGGDKAPIYQAQQLFTGIMSLAQNIDIAIFGHWHVPMYALFGGKLGLIAPSLASISDYEWKRGYRPSMGVMILRVGGGKPPTAEFWTPERLIRHKITKGYFSDKNLTREGFTTDANFDPYKHGYANRSQPKSALQKALWKITDDLLYPTQTII